MHTRRRLFAVATTAVTIAGALGGYWVFRPTHAGAEDSESTCVKADNGRTGPGHFRFITSACENSTATQATLPLHRGTSHGESVWYVVTDSSDANDAAARGVNFAPKLANALGTAAVQTVTVKDGVVNFPGTVDFSPKHVLTPGPNGFPPAKAEPGAVGDSRYSPLIKLANGVVLMAPQIANDSGKADKVLSLDKENNKVVYQETEGRYEAKHIHYMSFDSSSKAGAAIEDVTYAPNLDAAPSPGDENPATSARETLIAFTNGAVGAGNIYRQGVNSAILDHLDPHNNLHETPVLPQHADVGSTEYDPLWDIHLVEWTQDAINAGDRVEIRSFDEAMARITATPPLVTGFGGTPFGPSGFIVDCPLMSIDVG